LRSLGLAWNTKGLWRFYLKIGIMVVGFSGDRFFFGMMFEEFGGC
jgi:hypothetical protein